MKFNNKVVLFDIDHTLFDMGEFRKKMFGEILEELKYEGIDDLENLLQHVYFLYREESGTFDPKSFTQYLSRKLKIKTESEKLEKAIIKQEIFLGYLFEESEEVLGTLSKNKTLKIGIFSGGNTNFQKSKIKEIERHFHKEHIHIFAHKSKELLPVLEKYRNEKLYIIDDQLEILHIAKNSHKNVFTIWAKRGRYALAHKGIPGFRPNLTITNLREIVGVLSS
jgi:FMN phosphatase YigB (HAD superfamily)